MSSLNNILFFPLALEHSRPKKKTIRLKREKFLAYFTIPTSLQPRFSVSVLRLIRKRRGCFTVVYSTVRPSNCPVKNKRPDCPRPGSDIYTNVQSMLSLFNSEKHRVHTGYNTPFGGRIQTASP